MKRYCGYCGERCYTEFCNDFCRTQYDEYIQHVERYRIPFMIGTLFPLILLIFPIFFGHLLLFAGIALTLSGMTLTILPFCTNLTVDSMGVVPSIKTGRTIGIAILITGLLMSTAGMFI